LQTFSWFVTAAVASRIFASLVFPVVQMGVRCPRANMQVFAGFTELHERAALTRDRYGAYKLWHGMPTASVKNNHFQN
jgi:hypothetical protein